MSHCLIAMPGSLGRLVVLPDYAYFESLDKVKLFSGIQHLIIHVIANGLVMPHLLDR
jgi:hypothetical protein